MLACASALVASAIGATAGDAASAASGTTFQDATAEDAAAPDITEVVVSNSDAVWQHDGRPLARPSPIVTFRIEVPNRPVLTEDMRVSLWIDADDDPTTGLAGDVPFRGSDYRVNWDPKLGADAGLNCIGSGCRFAEARSLRFSYGGGATFSVLASELGDTRRFRFWARVYSGIAGSRETGLDFSAVRIDVAPEPDTAWTYRVLVRPKRLIADELSSAPAVPRAGRPFAVRLTALRHDTGEAVSSGRVTCRATVAGELLVARSQRFVARRATCVFRLPPDAAGKTIRGTIRIAFRGLHVTRAFSSRIR